MMVKKRNKEVIKGYFTVVQGRHQASQVALVVRIPWTEEPGGLQSMGPQRVGHDWSDLVHSGDSMLA